MNWPAERRTEAGFFTSPGAEQNVVKRRWCKEADVPPDHLYSMILHQHAATSMAIDSHLVVQLSSPIDRLHAAIARRSARAGSWYVVQDCFRPRARAGLGYCLMQRRKWTQRPRVFAPQRLRKYPTCGPAVLERRATTSRGSCACHSKDFVFWSPRDMRRLLI